MIEWLNDTVCARANSYNRFELPALKYFKLIYSVSSETHPMVLGHRRSSSYGNPSQRVTNMKQQQQHIQQQQQQYKQSLPSITTSHGNFDQLHSYHFTILDWVD